MAYMLARGSAELKAVATEIGARRTCYCAPVSAPAPLGPHSTEKRKLSVARGSRILCDNTSAD